MPHFEDLLTLAFESKGYRVTTNEHAPLVLEGEGERILIHWRAGAEVAPEDVEALQGIVASTDANHGVLLALDGAAEDALATAQGGHVDVWPAERVAAELTRALLAQVPEGCTLNPGEPTAARAEAAPAAPPANLFEAAARRPAMQSLAGFSAAAEAPPEPVAPRVTAAPTQPAQGQTRGVRSKFPSLIAQAASTSPTAGDAAMLLPSKPQPGATASKAVRPNALPYAWSASAASAAAPTHKGVAHLMDGRRRRQPHGIIDAESGDAELVSSRAPTPAPRAPAPRQPALDADMGEPAFELYDSKKGSWSELDEAGRQTGVSTPAEPAAQPQPQPQAAPAAAPAPQSGWEHPAPEGALRPNYTREQALEAVQQRTGDAREVTLELVPHYAYAYSMSVKRRELSNPLEARGRLLINALTGDVLDAPEKIETTDKLPVSTSPHRPNMGAGQAETVASKTLTRRHTRTIKAHRTISGVDMTETVHVRPERNELGLQNGELVYLPVWTIRGEYANVQLDAVTGHILQEKVDADQDIELL